MGHLLADSPKVPGFLVDSRQRHRDCAEAGMCTCCARRWSSSSWGQDSRGKAWVVHGEQLCGRFCEILIGDVPQLSSISGLATLRSPIGLTSWYNPRCPNHIPTNLPARQVVNFIVDELLGVVSGIL